MSTAAVSQIDEVKTTPWSGGKSPFSVEYGKMMMWFVLTIIGGFMFLGCQALEWTHLHNDGFWWGNIPKDLTEYFHGHTSATYAHQFANLFFTITGFHGFHVFSGVIINIIILINV